MNCLLQTVAVVYTPILLMSGKERVNQRACPQGRGCWKMDHSVGQAQGRLWAESLGDGGSQNGD